jgi:chromosomal replication initiator protein
LAGTEAVSLTDDELVVAAPSQFHVEWIEDKYGSALADLLEKMVGHRLDLVVITGKEPAPPVPSLEVRPEVAPSQQTSAPPGPGSRPDWGPVEHRVALNDRYTFARFVVGTTTQLAAAACHAVAEKPALVYNPLFLYGGVGLGKTHLMHAIGNHVLAADPSKRIAYITTEQFTNELVSSIQQGTTSEFRRRYRAIDLLLVDDIQFLEGKERTQEEFFHTFNALYDARKQIIVTSDRPPKELPGLEARLVSRFEWGLVVDVKAPDLETRMAILRKKGADDDLVMDEEVIDYIARHCTASVRELEGAVIKLLAFSSLTNQEITVGLARTALSGVLSAAPEGRPSINTQRIVSAVAREWEVTPEALASKRRTHSITVPRQVAMYLIKTLLDLPLVQIGDTFGGRDHSTVIHSIRKVEEEMAGNPDFHARVSAVRSQVVRGV